MPHHSRDAEFSDFVRLHRVDLMRSACLFCAGDVHRAEDLVQTALTRLYLAWPGVRRNGNPLGYARRIIVNAHLDETRRPRWRRERSVADPPEEAEPVGAVRVLEGGYGNDGVDGEAIRAALAALPDRMRAAVLLRHWLDLSVEESADLLGCSAGTIKSQTAKAVARLRPLLAAAEPERRA